MRSESQAVIALAPAPGGFTARELADKIQSAGAAASYSPPSSLRPEQTARGKQLVERIGTTRRYRPHPAGIATPVGLLILRERVIRPVLAGLCRVCPGPPPKPTTSLDLHYQNLQREMHRTLQTLALAAQTLSITCCF